MNSLCFNFFGLLFVMAGSALLFFYGVPSKRIGDTIIFGSFAAAAGDAQSAAQQGGNKPDWRGPASEFLGRATALNRAGFVMITLGALLQLIALFLPAH